MFAVLQLSSSVGAVGLVLAARTASQVLLLPFGGVVADRLPRAWLMAMADLGAAAAQALCAVLVLTHTAALWHLLVLQAAGGAALSFFFPASAGLVPQTVPSSAQPRANALLRLSFSGSQVFGAALGGLVVSAAGPGWGLAVDALSFLVSAIVVVPLRSLANPAAAASGFFRELADGWLEFRGRTWLWAIVCQFTLMLALGTSAMVALGPIVAQRDLGGAKAWGLLSAVLAAGGLAGALLTPRLPQSRPLIVATFAIALNALPLAGLAGTRSLPALVVLFIAAGVGTSIFDILWESALQAHIPPQALSRVSSFDLLGSLGLAPVGYALMGPLVAGLGLRGTLWLGVGAVLVPAAAVLAIPDVRRLRSGPPVTSKALTLDAG